MKINKFGLITEEHEGTLLFQDFIIDAVYSDLSNEELIIEAVIARLQSELDQIRDKKKS